jgi:hypothetical protein
MEKVITPKTIIEKEQKIRSEHPLTPSRFLQPWEYNFLFTFNKYTTNISTGISSVSANSSSSSNNSSDNESENKFIDQKP